MTMPTEQSECINKADEGAMGNQFMEFSRDIESGRPHVTSNGCNSSTLTGSDPVYATRMDIGVPEY